MISPILRLTCAFGFFWAVVAYANDSPVRDAAAPPRVCEIRQATWCIYLSGTEIVDRPSLEARYASTWLVRGVLQPDNPYVVLEPRGCRNGLSDVVEFLTPTSKFRWENRWWNRIVVRLKSDYSCDLELLSPIIEDDALGEAFSESLTSIQSCTTLDCRGVVIAERLSKKIERE